MKQRSISLGPHCCEKVTGGSCGPDTCQMVLFLKVGSHGAELCMGSWQSRNYCRNYPHFMEPEGSLPYSQVLYLFLFFEFPNERSYAFVSSDFSMWHEPPAGLSRCPHRIFIHSIILQACHGAPIASSYTLLSCRPVAVLFGPPFCYLSLLGPDMVPRALRNSLSLGPPS
jgi:hypothetical protein